MIPALMLTGLSMILSLVFYKLIRKEKYSWIRWKKHRTMLILFIFSIVIPIAIYEKYTGHFDSWSWSFFLNGWEAFCFSIGLFYSDLCMKVGWLENIKK